jgi:CII-binding regulator of phage lambda lysogenization HflD
VQGDRSLNNKIIDGERKERQLLNELEQNISSLEEQEEDRKSQRDLLDPMSSILADTIDRFAEVETLTPINQGDN